MRHGGAAVGVVAGLAIAGGVWFGGGGPQPVDSTIQDVQGAGDWSPLEGRLVAVEGVVAAVGNDSYWLATADAEQLGGIRISWRESKPAVGERVRVSGMVVERVLGNSLDQSETIIEQRRSPQFLGRAARPEPQLLETFPESGSAAEVNRFWEPLEGRLVTLPATRVTGPLSRHGEVFVVAREASSPNLAAKGAQPHTIALTGEIVELPPFAVDDQLMPITGTVGYAYGSWRLHPVALPVFEPGGTSPERTALVTDSEGITIATYNVHNLHPGAGPERFQRLAEDIAVGLRAPAIIALQEVQDNNGPIPGGTRADRTYSMLLEALPDELDYRVAQVDPVDRRDGGQPEGNIRCALLWRPDLVTLESRGASGSRAAVAMQADGWPLPNPGLLEPADAAFVGSRKPLVACFRVRGRRLLVVVLHLSSKFGDSPFLGRAQPPVVESAVPRRAQAAAVAAFVRRQAASADLDVIVLGDCNDLPGSTALAPLRQAGLIHLTEEIPPADRFSYLYRGRRQLIDQVWISASLQQGTLAADVVHRNTIFPFANRASDHDPVIVRLAIPEN